MGISWPAEEELYFTSIGVMLQPDGINSENISPEEYREHLPAGHYRVVKEFYGAGGEITQRQNFPFQNKYTENGSVPYRTGPFFQYGFIYKSQPAQTEPAG